VFCRKRKKRSENGEESKMQDRTHPKENPIRKNGQPLRTDIEFLLNCPQSGGSGVGKPKRVPKRQFDSASEFKVQSYEGNRRRRSGGRKPTIDVDDETLSPTRNLL